MGQGDIVVMLFVHVHDELRDGFARFFLAQGFHDRRFYPEGLSTR